MNISYEVQIPESLCQEVRILLDENPTASVDAVISAAIELFSRQEAQVQRRFLASQKLIAEDNE